MTHKRHDPPDTEDTGEQHSWFQRVLLGRSDIVFGGKLYMKRWRLIHRKWFGIRLHKIERSDNDRELHDHPFSFLSFILSGGYIEHRPFGVSRVFRPGSFVFRRAEALHRLSLFIESVSGTEDLVKERAAWTVVFRGPERRRWGFMTEQGWVDADDFERHKEAKQNRNYVESEHRVPREVPR